MAKIVMEEQEDYPVLPADSILFLKIDNTEVRQVSGRNGDWEKLEFTFKILGIQACGDGGPTERFDSLVTSKIWGSVPFRLTESAENKLRLWLEAIFKMELQVGFELDTDYLVGKEVRGITSTYDKKSIDPKTGQPFKAHQITSLLPMGGDIPQAAAPAADPWATPAAAAAPAGGNSWDAEPPF